MKWKSLCNITAVFQGVWEFISNPTTEMAASMADPWKYCPNTKQNIIDNRNVPMQDLTYQMQNYSCYNRSYRYAQYIPDGCHLNPIRSSLRKIDYVAHHSYDVLTNTLETKGEDYYNKMSGGASRMLSMSLQEGHPISEEETTRESSTHISHHHMHSGPHHSHRIHGHEQLNQLRRNHIYYVGDSLTAQMYVAGKCIIEELGFERDFNLTWIAELFLRNDIPCQDICLDNPALYSRHKEFHNPCGGCPDGKRFKFDHTKLKGYWYNRITPDTMAVVIGTGAWYNGHKGILNSDEVYEETMTIISPMIQDLIHNRNISVFWLGLPPNGNDTVNIFYEWSRYRNKDKLARKHLEPLGVVFLDNMPLVDQRKKADPNLNPDDFHWW